MVNKLIDWTNRVAKIQNNKDVYLKLTTNILNKPAEERYRALVLPAQQWVFESNLAELYSESNFEFVGVERDQETFDLSSENAIKLESIKTNAKFMMATPAPIELIDYLIKYKPEKDGKYDLIYADWYGGWAEEKREQVRLFFEKQMFKPNSNLVLTLSLNRGPKDCPAMAELISMMEKRYDVIEDVDFEHIEIDGKTREVLARCEPTSKAKVFGLSNVVKAEAEANGMEALVDRIKTYSGFDSDTGGRTSPEISLTYTIRAK